MVRTLEQSGQARLGTRPASLRFSVYPKQIIDNTLPYQTQSASQYLDRYQADQAQWLMNIGLVSA